MYEAKILKLKEVPVFSLSDAAQIVSGKGYAKKLLARMVARGEMRRLGKRLYSFHDDDFLVSTFLVKPSYISSISALAHYRLITQIPKDVYCFTIKRSASVRLNSEIRFFRTKYFFGFDEIEYAGFRIPVAGKEKAIIDSIGIVPVSVFEEAVEKADLRMMMLHLGRIKKSSVLKRVGFLLERNGFDVHDELKKYINGRYVPLDPLAGKKGKRDRRWRLVVNA